MVVTLAIAVAPLLGLATWSLILLFAAFLLLSSSPVIALAGVMSLATSGVCCALLGHYIGLASGSASNSKLYVKAGGFFGIVLVVCDPHIIEGLAAQLMSQGQAMPWQISGWIGARLSIAVCKVCLSLSILAMIVEMPLHILGPRGKTECVRALSALRPFILLGFLGIMGNYILSMWSDVYLPLLK